MERIGEAEFASTTKLRVLCKENGPPSPSEVTQPASDNPKRFGANPQTNPDQILNLHPGVHVDEIEASTPHYSPVPYSPNNLGKGSENAGRDGGEGLLNSLVPESPCPEE